MKKIVLTFVILLLVSGCVIKQNKITSINETTAPAGADNYNDGDIINRIDALKNGLKPNVKPSGAPADEQAQAQANQQSGQRQLENLAAQFDSAVLKTNFGDITVKFYAQESPITVNNFMNLAKASFYNGTKFHRVIKDFMIQGGDPLSKDDNPANDGTGGPGYQFQDEINSHKLVKGSLAMANSGPNTNGSQFFIVTAAATAWLDGKHTNFGYVAAGLDVVEKIQQVKVNQNDHPIEDVIINGVELTNSKAEPPASASSTPPAGQEEKGSYNIEN